MIFAELSERQDRIDVHFPYDPIAVAKIKLVAGRRFIGKDKGGPFWRCPLDLETARELRRHFPDLVLGDGLRAWGRDQVQRERNLASLAVAEDAELTRAPALVPELCEVIDGKPQTWLGLPPLPNGEPHPLMRDRSPRPYQRADIAMMAQCNPLNANQPGTGKTLEWIGAVAETPEVEWNGSHLIINLVTAHWDPWVVELTRYTDHPVLWGDSPEGRADAIREAKRMDEAGEPFWLVVGYDDVRLYRDKEQPKKMIEGKLQHPFAERHPDLFKIAWESVLIDEFHKSGLPNQKSLFARGAARLDAAKRGAMSGTPMGGKPRRLFPTLQWLQPSEYTSFWTWAEKWLHITENDLGYKSVGGLRGDVVDEFYRAHARIMVRRMKREALPGLPEVQWNLVECPMTPKQRAQYSEFAKEAELAIDEGRIAATNVLTEYTRLKQFANSRQELRDGSPYPTTDSGKLPLLLDRLAEQGVRVEEPEPRTRAIVASASQLFVEVVEEYLGQAGIAARRLDGTVTGADRNAVIEWYKDGTAEEPRVIVMTTQTGGVSLNLEITGSVHILDETWNPDDQEQLIDRGDRGERTTALVVYTYRTAGTIQEYIAEVGEGKKITNSSLLDLRQRGLRSLAA
jgi:hypothetical protein